jgi:hypothetical protein
MKTRFSPCTGALARTLAAVLTVLASSPGWSERAHAEEAHAEPALAEPAHAEPALAEPAHAGRAHVDENVSAAPVALEPESQSNSKSHHGPDWGWLVLGPSLVAGAACTGYGLLLDCAGADPSCPRRASLAIWGGVGIASLGSLVGMALLQPWAVARQATASSVDVQIELSADSNPAGSLLPGGALLRLAGPLHW